MKIRLTKLKQIIREEIQNQMLNEITIWKSAEYEEIDYAIHTIRNNLRFLPPNEVRKIKKNLEHLENVNNTHGTEEIK